MIWVRYAGIMVILGMIAGMCGTVSAAGVSVNPLNRGTPDAVYPVCTAPCECMTESYAGITWGAEGYEKCSKTICGETADGNIQYYCIHQKGTAVGVPEVTTTAAAAVPQEVKVPVSSAAVPATPSAVPSTIAAGITQKVPVSASAILAAICAAVLAATGLRRK